MSKGRVLDRFLTLAVTATEEKKSKKERRQIAVAGVRVGLDNENELTNSVVSRIKFAIEVVLPNTTR